MAKAIDSLRDTIVACATPAGAGAIGVVRLSGPRARAIAGSLTNRARTDRPSHRLQVVHIVGSDGEPLDRGMMVEMHAPRSYTGEDVVELHLHGSRAVIDGVIEASVARGARLARPGEFTLRAFLNGRLDLAQAEAVEELIASRNEAHAGVAVRQLNGGLSREIGELLGRTEAVITDWRAALDFPDYPTGLGRTPEHLEGLRHVACRIQAMVSGARVDLGRGRSVVLCGAPNVGKSTLLNALAGGSRALVDDSPGTTRDPVEVELGSGLVKWVAIDTAGIRPEATGLEARGIAMALERAQQADLRVWLVSADPVERAWPVEDLDMEVVVAATKSDLGSNGWVEAVERECVTRRMRFMGAVSAKRGVGVAALADRIQADLQGECATDTALVVKRRHLDALKRAEAALGRGMDPDVPLDLACMDLEEAARTLGEVVGHDVDASVLDRVFESFCIGK